MSEYIRMSAGYGVLNFAKSTLHSPLLLQIPLLHRLLLAPPAHLFQPPLSLPRPLLPLLSLPRHLPRHLLHRLLPAPLSPERLQQKAADREVAWVSEIPVKS